MPQNVEIPQNDIEDLRQTLAACLRYFQAKDLATAQVAYAAPNPSPLTQEIERVLQRLDFFWGDFLIRLREELLEEDEVEEELELETETEETEDDEETEEAEAEEDSPLSKNPLGSVKTKRQTGRRLRPEEV